MFKDLPNRHTTRLHEYDYSQLNWYYVTICTNHHENMFVGANQHLPVPPSFDIQLNKIGQTTQQCWLDIPIHNPNVKLDKYVIMPNHVHGIIIINYQKQRANIDSPLHGTSGTIGAIVRGFKIGVTKWCRTNTQIHDVWQRNYYEHIIRDEGELTHIRKYITDNPKNWLIDKLNVGANQHLPVKSNIWNTKNFLASSSTVI